MGDARYFVSALQYSRGNRDRQVIFSGFRFFGNYRFEFHSIPIPLTPYTRFPLPFIPDSLIPGYPLLPLSRIAYTGYGMCLKGEP
jgi:hypothetical protein